MTFFHRNLIRMQHKSVFDISPHIRYGRGSDGPGVSFGDRRVDVVVRDQFNHLSGEFLHHWKQPTQSTMSD